MSRNREAGGRGEVGCREREEGVGKKREPKERRLVVGNEGLLGKLKTTKHFSGVEEKERAGVHACVCVCMCACMCAYMYGVYACMCLCMRCMHVCACMCV